jgi:hypothetical protein
MGMRMRTVDVVAPVLLWHLNKGLVGKGRGGRGGGAGAGEGVGGGGWG